MTNLFHVDVHFSTFFVLNGLLNGEEDSIARTTDENDLSDGWYYVKDGDADPECTYPFISEQAAITHAREYYSMRMMDEVLGDIDDVIKSWVRKGFTRGEILTAMAQHYIDSP